MRLLVFILLFLRAVSSERPFEGSDWDPGDPIASPCPLLQNDDDDVPSGTLENAPVGTLENAPSGTLDNDERSRTHHEQADQAVCCEDSPGGSDTGCAPVRRLVGERAHSAIYHRSDGYFFYLQRSSPNVQYLRCRHSRTALHCPARGFLSPNFTNLQHNVADHNHDSDVGYEQENEFVQSLLQEARNRPCQRLDVLFHNISSRYPVGVSSRVSLHSVRSRLRRAQMLTRPAIPVTFSETNRALLDRAYEGLSATMDGSDSVFCGMAGVLEGQQGLVFTSQRLLAELHTFRTLFFDGTFFCLPVSPRASQLLTLVGVRDNHVVPLVHVLMQGRSYECYMEVFSFLTMRANINPHTVMSDFEPALLASLQQCFPGATQSGCLWHFASAVCRYVRQLNIHILFRGNENLRLIVRMSLAIPLCPPNLIRNALDVIIAEARRHDLGQILQPYFDYLRNQWLNRVGPDVLSVFGAPHRTNNVNECHNRNLNSKIGVKRPNIWKFLDVIKQVEDTAWRDMDRLRQGINPSRLRRRSVLSNNRRIQSCSRQLVNGEMSLRSFLRTVCYTLEGVFRDSFRELRDEAIAAPTSVAALTSVAAPTMVAAPTSVADPNVRNSEADTPHTNVLRRVCMEAALRRQSSSPMPMPSMSTPAAMDHSATILASSLNRSVEPLNGNHEIVSSTPISSPPAIPSSATRLAFSSNRSVQPSNDATSSTSPSTLPSTAAMTCSNSRTAIETTSLGSALMSAAASARGRNTHVPQTLYLSDCVRTNNGWVSCQRIFAEGDCLFRAISHQIGFQFSSSNLREMSVNFLLRNANNYEMAINDLVEQLTESGEIARGYSTNANFTPQAAALQTLRSSQTWGGMESVVALSNVLQRHFEVYVEGREMVPIRSNGPVVTDEPIRIIHRLVRQADGTLRHTHFDSVLSISDAHPSSDGTMVSPLSTVPLVATNAFSFLENGTDNNRLSSVNFDRNANFSHVVLVSDDESATTQTPHPRLTQGTSTQVGSDDSADDFEPPRIRRRTSISTSTPIDRTGRARSRTSRGVRRRAAGRRGSSGRGTRSRRSSRETVGAAVSNLRTFSVDVFAAIPAQIPVDNNNTSDTIIERRRWQRCCVCNDNEGLYAAVPCGGFPLCNVCVRTWAVNGHITCPHCRGPLSDLVHVRNVNPE